MPESNPSTILMTADTVGGVWTYAMELSRGLSSCGIRVVLATMGEPLSAAQCKESAGIEGLQVVESTYKLEWMPDPWTDVDAAGRWLLDLENQFHPDIIHLNGYAHGSLPWKAPVLIFGHSCVLSWWKAVRGEQAPPDWNEYRQRVSRGLQNATMVAAPTRTMLDALTEHYGELPATRVLHNGRQTDLFHAGRKKQPFIFAAGRLGDEAKNIQALGNAAEGLPWPVFVAGAESDASGSHPLPENVNRCGQLSPTAVAEWMRSASIYCFPARYEPFGLSILEAALSGCALVLGDIPTLRELWDGCAIFVPPGDPAAIRDALRDLITNPTRRTQLTATSQLRARDFSHDRFIESYLQTYRTLLTTQQSSILAA